MTIPTDDELDATVARLEPRLFMTLGARSRRRRIARTVGGSAAAVGLVAAGLAIGVYLVPSVASAPTSNVAVPGPSPSSSSPTIFTGTEKSPPSPSVVCHSADGAVTARVQVPVAPADPVQLCGELESSGVIFGAERQPASAHVACVGGSEKTDVYASDPGNTSAHALCARYGASVFSGRK